MGGSWEGKIRRWRTEDGKEVGTPMDAGSAVNNIAVSRDGKWIVSGTISGELMVWDAEKHKKVTEWKGHRLSEGVQGVDISPDGTRIATASIDDTACVWSLSTGQRLLSLNDGFVNAVKFSPDGRLIVTAAWPQDSIWVYDSQSGDLLVDVPIAIKTYNQCLAWVSNSKKLFALSENGRINCLEVSTGTTLSSWLIHSSKDPLCVALASNGKFIAASAGSSVSFWDTTTHQQIGSIINHTDLVTSMAISANYDLVTGGGNAITLRNIRDVLPSSYHTDVSPIASNARCMGFVPNDKLLC